MEEPTRTQDRQLERDAGGSCWLREDRRGRLRFSPVTVIVIASVLTIVLLGGLGVQTWQSYQDYQHILNWMEGVGQKNIDIDIERYQQRALIAVILVLVELPCLLLIWFLVFRNMRKYLKERDKLNDEVAKSEAKYKSLFQNSQGAIILLNTNDESIFDANGQACKLLGYSYGEFLALTIWDLHPEEERSRWEQLKKQAFSMGSFKEVENIRFRRKDGSDIPVSVNATIIGSEPFPIGLIYFHDISEKKLAEQERERLVRTLATKNEELQSIVYVASHDLKTPLVNILGFSGELSKTCEQLKIILESKDVAPELRAKLAPLVYEDAPEALRFIVAGGSKMQSLLNGLLEISRVGSAPINIEVLDMNGMMRGVVASMQFQISDSGADVNIDQLPQCRADDDSINQVFSNLLVNAVKYLDPKRQGVINVTGEVVDGEAIYCVEDNGLGIASGQQQKVFEIFHRLDPGGNVKGEGLGLTIALRILERHEGRIWVESEQGKGCRFFVSLPAA